MSIKLIDAVFKYSEAKSSAKLVLLAIANFVNDAGDAYPGIALLRRYTNLSRRQVQRQIRVLEERAELDVAKGKGPYGTNRYRVTLTTPGMTNSTATGGVFSRATVTPVSPNPFSETNKETIKTQTKLSEGVTLSVVRSAHDNFTKQDASDNSPSAREAICVPAIQQGMTYPTAAPRPTGRPKRDLDELPDFAIIDLIRMWNDVSKATPCSEHCLESAKFRNQILKLMHAYPTRLVWQDLFRKISSNQYLLTGGKTGAGAITFPWLVMDPQNFEKVKVGYYDRQRQPKLKGII